ncbi:MAG: cell division protein FtsL [Beggiatoa sp. IS2]|nr:MAG: cell division protein FtsL [Beggiatoa sp. IS2]
MLRLMSLILIIAVFVSAVQIVLVRHQNRVLFNELQMLQQQYDTYNIEWGQLQLEQSTWGQPKRIEDIARTQLGMTPPKPPYKIVIRLNN